MEVKVISRETIKPSSPTPPHLRTYNISLLDLLYAPVYVPVFLCYHPTNVPSYEINQQSRWLTKLKQSLSETLTRFYPLAGGLNEDGRHINCDDRGVVFCVARVKNCDMSELSGETSHQLGLFPMQPWAFPSGADDYVQVGIQLNMFDCGGIGLAVLFSHKIIDAITIASFLKCWASISQGGRDDHITIRPNYSAASLYPVKDYSLLDDDLFRPSFTEKCFVKEGENPINRKFSFNKEAIAALKSRAMSKDVPDPTRFEALSSFIWKHAMAASKVVSGGRKRPSVLTFAVDLRRRIAPALPECTLGNLIWNLDVLCDGAAEIEGQETDLNGLVGLLRAGMKEIGDEFLPKSQGVKGYDAICEKVRESKEMSSAPNLNAYICTSWIGVGFYELDFGWGNPAKIGFIGDDHDLKVKNITYLIEAGHDEESIHAYINLEQSEMTVLGNDPEFLAFASPTIRDQVRRPTCGSC